MLLIEPPPSAHIPGRLSTELRTTRRRAEKHDVVGPARTDVGTPRAKRSGDLTDEH